MSKRVSKILITSLLVIGMLSCSFSVYAVDADPVPTYPPGYEDYLSQVEMNNKTMARFIWLLLNSWGIRITYQELEEYNEYVEQHIIEWVIEYLISLPSSYTIDQWIAPWQVGYDYWGNFRGNANMLEDVQEFADWLVDRLSLEDNSTKVINPVMSLGAYNLYELNTWYYADRGNSPPAYIYIQSGMNNGTSPDYYFVWRDTRDNSYNLVFLKNLSWAGQLAVRLTNDIQDIDTQTVGYRTSTQSWASQSVAPWWIWVVNFNNYYPFGATYFSGDNVEFGSFMRNATVTYEGDVKVITGSIVLPPDNPTYTPGDGITIIDGEPTYEEITFSGEITNLPAIVSTGEIDNPEIDQIYTNIPALVEEAGSSMEIFRQIIFRLPDGVLIALYAMLSAGVIFGFLRLMREH